MLELLQNIRWADIADILLVAVIIYAVLIWLHRTASLTVLVGAPIVAAIYIAARTFGMYLTTMIFHGLFAVVLIGLIILFQDDLRRTLGRRNRLWWLRARADGSNHGSDIELLTQTLFALAAERIGALVVIVGREPLDKHTEGGLLLGGQLSGPLLLSLFDSHSPGHDGAVIVEGWRVQQFGVHLPLSHNLDRIADRGTRHSAALGLSERTDALVLVVSEERGSISVAEDGQIETVETPADLQQRIERYQRQRRPHPPTHRRSLWRWTRDWPTKLLAVALACTGWFVLGYQPELVERSFRVPIEYVNLPEQLELDGTQPAEVEVTLSGRRTAFSLLQPEQLKVSLNLSGAIAGAALAPLDPEDVDGRLNLTVTRLEPPAIRYRLTRRGETPP